MAAQFIRETDDEIFIQLSIPKSSDFLECESQIQDSLNEAGRLATQYCLSDFDSDGSPIIVAGTKLTAKKSKVSKKYETPFGVVPVERFVYQSSQGGHTHIPLEVKARIVGKTTPRFAKIVSFKYSATDAETAKDDLRQTLNRNVSRDYIQKISASVADFVKDKSAHWEYASSDPSPEDVCTIAIGLDGASLTFCDEGYRQAMVGTIAFYNQEGERLHTIYIATEPEYGKETFFDQMDKEIARIKQIYSDVRYVGISDGAKDFLPWLKKHTTTQVLDFWHVSDYLKGAAQAIARKKEEQEKWIESTCHNLKHDHGAAQLILTELEQAATKQQSIAAEENLTKAISYIGNNLGRMNYASYRKTHIPIGSGVTEAACKTIIKKRMCGSGMKWVSSGARTVLTLRAMARTKGRWEEFWQKIAKFGI